MNKLFDRTKMMDEAKIQSKAHSPVIELLICLAVFVVTSFAQSILITPALMYYIFSDQKLAEIMQSGSQNVDALMNRMYEIISIMPQWLIILQLFATVMTVAGVIIYCRFIEKRSVASMGLRRGHILREYSVGLLAGLILIALVVGLCVISGSSVFNGLNAVSIPLIIIYFPAYLIQGMSEELLFRGYFMTSMTKSTGVTYALVISSVMFALAHSANTSMSMLSYLNLFLYGVVAGLYVIKRGNIWGAAAMHTAWNFAQGCLFGCSVSGTPKNASIFTVTAGDSFTNLNGGAFGPEGGLFTTLILFLALGLLLTLKPNKKELSIPGDTQKTV